MPAQSKLAGAGAKRERGDSVGAVLRKASAKRDATAQVIAANEELDKKADFISNVAEINALLSEKPARAAKVLKATKRGQFDATFWDPSHYFNEQYTLMHRIPAGHLNELLPKLHPRITPAFLKRQPRLTVQLYLYSQRSHMKADIYSDMEAQFDETSVDVHTHYGRPLASLDYTISVESFWLGQGVYQLLPPVGNAPPGEHRFTKVAMYNRVEADLPKEYIVSDEWFISDNWCFKTSRLCSPNRKFEFVLGLFEKNQYAELLPNGGGAATAGQDEEKESEEQVEEEEEEAIAAQAPAAHAGAQDAGELRCPTPAKAAPKPVEEQVSPGKKALMAPCIPGVQGAPGNAGPTLSKQDRRVLAAALPRL